MNELHLGSADPIKEIAELARTSQASVGFLAIPSATLPSDLVIKDPHVMVVKDGKGNVDVKSFKPFVEDLRGKPSLREGTATTTTLDSFIDLLSRHANQSSAVFVDANWKAPKFTAVVDYHAEVNGPAFEQIREAKPGEDPYARNLKHRIIYTFPLSEPWKVWIENNGKPMDQADFALFIEDHIHEVASPKPEAEMEMRWQELFRTKFAEPTMLVELARGLEVHESARVKSHVKLQSGEAQMVFETEHRDASGNELTVPGLFLVAVPVFYRGDILRIPARLRYRVRGGALTWSYELHRPDEFVDEHVRSAVEQVRAATGLPTYDGAPEVR